MIGILEYAPLILESSNPYEDLIKMVINLLNKDGKILIAVDNRLGTKYFAGGKSEHYDKIFGSITGKNDGTSKLFTKCELENLLNKFNFNNLRFYYPLPDYKFTNVIFSDDYLPNNNSKIIYNGVYNKNSIIVNNEISLIKEFNYNNEFKNHANSFLVEVNGNLKDNNIKFVNYNNFRKKKYSLNLKMYKDSVEKMPSSNVALEHVNDIQNNINTLKEMGFTIDETVENYTIKSKIIEKEQFSSVLYRYIVENNIDEFYKKIDLWYECIYSKLHKEEGKKAINKELVDFEIDEYLLNQMDIIENGFIDLVFENTFFENNKFVFIDQEWYLKNIPIQYILYRAINNFYIHNDNINDILKLEDVLIRYDLLKFSNIFDKMELNFQNMVIDKNMLKFYGNQYKYIKDITEIFKIENEIDYFEKRRVDINELKEIYEKYMEQEESIKEINKEVESLKKYKTCLETEIASYKDSRLFRFVLKINKIFRKKQ